MTHDEFWSQTDEGDFRTIVWINRYGTRRISAGTVKQVYKDTLHAPYNIRVVNDGGYDLPLFYREIVSVI